MAKAPRTSDNARASTAADPDISRVDRGMTTSTTAGITEDQKRAQGIDASQDAGEHDTSAAATASQAPGGTVIDSYAGNAGGYHGNVVGEPQPLVLGQAPVGRAAPLRGSENHNERFHPAVPNGINQSPVLHGVDEDGVRTVPEKTFGSMRRELLAQGEGHEADEREKAEQEKVEG